MSIVVYVPVTPGGTVCDWLAKSTEQEAWDALLQDAEHMPYDGIDGFKQRGYTVEKFTECDDESADE